MEPTIPDALKAEFNASGCVNVTFADGYLVVFVATGGVGSRPLVFTQILLYAPREAVSEATFISNYCGNTSGGGFRKVTPDHYIATVTYFRLALYHVQEGAEAGMPDYGRMWNLVCLAQQDIADIDNGRYPAP